MKSTGEAMGVGETFGEAFYKAQLGCSAQAPMGGKAIISVREADKGKLPEVGRALIACGFELIATSGTAKTLVAAGIPCQSINKVTEGRPHIVDIIKNDEIDYIVNTTEGKKSHRRFIYDSSFGLATQGRLHDNSGGCFGHHSSY